MQGNREKKKLAVVVIQRWRDGVRKDFTFKTLVKYIGEFKWDAVLTPVLVVMEVIFPIIMAVIIDHGLESQSLGKVVLIGFAMNLRQAMYEKI